MSENCPRCGAFCMEQEAEISTLGHTELITVCSDCGWEINRKPFGQNGMTV